MGFGVLFVRQLTQDEVDTFRRVSKCAIDGRLALRYQAIWFSHLGKSVQEIAELLDVSVESVRNWIHIFEEDGFEGLADDWRSGRPPKANEAYIERLLDMVHISSLRAEHGEQGPLPSLRMAARAIVLESATQELVKKHGFKRKKATTVATHMLRRYSEW